MVAPPPKVAPLKVMADGVADWQTVTAEPAATMGICETVIVFVDVTAGHEPGALVVNNKVTMPL